MTQVESNPPEQAPSTATAPSSNNYPVLARQNGSGTNGSANGGANASADSNGTGGISLDDPRSRVLLEQLLTTLSQETAPNEDKPARNMGPGYYVAALRRRWRPMAFIFLVASALVMWRLKPGPPTYTTTATMLLPSSGGSGGGDADAALKALGTHVVSGGNIETQLAIVKGPDVVATAMKRLPHNLRAKGWGNPNATWTGVTATAPVSTDLIDITTVAGDPHAAIALANGLIRAYAERLTHENKKGFAQNLKYLEEQVDAVKKKLDKAKLNLQNYKEKTKVYTVETRLAQITTTIQNLKDEATKADNEVAAGANSATVLADATTTSLQQKSTEAKLRYDTILREYFATAPEAIKAKQDLEADDQLVKRRLATLTQTQQSHARIAHQELAQAQQEASSLPLTEYRLTELMGQVSQYLTTYNSLNNSLINMNLQTNSSVSTASTLTPATAATPAVRTWRQAAMTAMLCALVLAALAAILLEQVDNTLHSPDDLEPLLPHTAVLGTMPLLKKPAERRLMQVNGTGTAAPLLLESCRIIRSNLAFATLDSPARSVLITSADPGEGKSMCALNLATVMAFDGRKVVLIDCDLRRPAQHLLNQLPLEPGVSNVIAGEATLDQTVRQTAISNLWVMPAGSLQPNPPELLGSGPCRQMLQDLKERFDMVIIDSPPVLSLTDAQVICSIAEGVVMVVSADSTAKPHVKRAQAMLRHAGGRVLGVILNKIRASNNPDAYSAYYSYYGDDKQLGGAKGFLTRGR